MEQARDLVTIGMKNNRYARSEYESKINDVFDNLKLIANDLNAREIGQPIYGGNLAWKYKLMDETPEQKAKREEKRINGTRNAVYVNGEEIIPAIIGDAPKRLNIKQEVFPSIWCDLESKVTPWTMLQSAGREFASMKEIPGKVYEEFNRVYEEVSKFASPVTSKIKQLTGRKTEYDGPSVIGQIGRGFGSFARAAVFGLAVLLSSGNNADSSGQLNAESQEVSQHKGKSLSERIAEGNYSRDSTFADELLNKKLKERR